MDQHKFEKVPYADSAGCTFMLGKSTRRNGEVVTSSPVFQCVAELTDCMDQLTLTDDKVILSSFPKSGSHWMYEILTILNKGHASPGEKYKLGGIDSYRFKTLEDLQNLFDQDPVNVLCTHMLPQSLPTPWLANHKIVHLARNPKSIAASLYERMRNIQVYEYEGTFQGYLPTFLKGYYSLYGNWFEYIKKWWDCAQSHSNVYFMFYEDLKKNPEQEITKLSEFLGHKHSPEFISQVANLSSFDVMKTSVGKPEEAIRFVTGIWKHGKNGFIRKGLIDDWKNYFTVAQNEMYDVIYEQNMKDYPQISDKIQFE